MSEYKGDLIGIKIYVDKYFPTKQKPRSLPKTKNKRIRRKWVKRYGYINLPSAYNFNGQIICNQEYFNRIKP